MDEVIVMDEVQIRRALMRIAHEILEKNADLGDLAIVGIRTRGVHLAERIKKFIEQSEGITIPMGILDITLHRDDLFSKKDKQFVVQTTEIGFSIEAKDIILVDDVLFSGRSVRAAMDELIDFGRPRKIQLAVLVDRGHRELPIRADYVGKNIPTSLKETVQVRLKEVDGKDEVVIIRE